MDDSSLSAKAADRLVRVLARLPGAGGLAEPNNPEDAGAALDPLRRAFFSIFAAFGILFLVVELGIAINEGRALLIILFLVHVGLAAVAAIAALRTGNYETLGFVCAVFTYFFFVMGFCAALFYNEISYLFWGPIFIPVIYFFQGYRKGVLWSLLFVVSIAAAYVLGLALGARPFPTGIVREVSISFIAISTFFAIFELMRSTYATMLREAQDQLEQLAATDQMTGILNRRRTEGELVREIERAARTQSELSLILFDIDHFKAVNDDFGHQEGDRVLQAVCHRVTEEIRSIDVFGRWGGEEFLLIMPETALDGATNLAERIRVAISNDVFAGDRKITASFGVAAYRRGESKEWFLRRVDRAMYRAKDEGRNCVRTADDSSQVVE